MIATNTTSPATKGYDLIYLQGEIDSQIYSNVRALQNNTTQAPYLATLNHNVGYNSVRFRFYLANTSAQYFHTHMGYISKN